MTKKLFYLALISLFFQSNLISQETIQVEGATGVGIMAGSISERAARREALNDAKVEALRKAGVTEHLSSYELLFRSETDRDYSEFFSSDVHAELQGAVQHYEVVNEQRYLDSDTDLFTIEVTIDATVILYSSRPDPTFNVSIEGIKGIYDEGEELTFTIYSTKDCYLHIFSLADSYTGVLYPNSIESQKMIEANRKVTFPMGFMSYPTFKPTKEPETTRVVFVFTKKPVRFLNYKTVIDEGFEDWVTTPEKIFSWIYSLTPDIRRVDYHVFTVR